MVESALLRYSDLLLIGLMKTKVNYGINTTTITNNLFEKNMKTV